MEQQTTHTHNMVKCREAFYCPFTASALDTVKVLEIYNTIKEISFEINEHLNKKTNG